MTTENKIQVPEYLKPEYVIPMGENKRELLESLLTWYWCSWAILKENIMACNNGGGVQEFLDEIDNCKTMKEIRQLVNKYV